MGTSSPGLDFSVTGNILGSGILNLTGTGTSTASGGLSVNTLDVKSTTATSTFGGGIQLSGGCYRTQDGRCLKEQVTIVKTSDETVNNSATLQNDDQLFLPMAAGERWFFTVTINHVGNTTADLQYTFTIPTGATIRWGCMGTGLDVSEAIARCSSVTASGTVVTTAGFTTENQIVLAGVVVNGSTTGNLQFQWAQNTATAVDTKVLANSYLMAWRQQ